MIHVDGPKQWTNTGKNEAMAEAVLSALHRKDLVTDAQRDYLAGLLSPEAAAATGLPVEPDAQAAYVLATLLNPAVRRTVSPAIRDVTATARVSAERRTEVVGELALRPILSLASILPKSDQARTQIEEMAPAYPARVGSASIRQEAGRSPAAIPACYWKRPSQSWPRPPPTPPPRAGRHGLSSRPWRSSTSRGPKRCSASRSAAAGRTWTRGARVTSWPP